MGISLELVKLSLNLKLKFGALAGIKFSIDVGSMPLTFVTFDINNNAFFAIMLWTVRIL